MKNQTPQKFILWIAVTAFVALAVLFAVMDLQIMQRYANPNSVWAHYFEAYGQLPGMLTGFLGGLLSLRFVLQQETRKKSLRTIGTIILYGLLTLFLAFGFWGDAMGMQIGADVNFALVTVLALLSLIVGQVILSRISGENLQSLKPFARTALWLFILVNILVWTIKISWGRMTYRNILASGDLSLFSPWYLPQGNTGNHSFISGHTAIGFCVLPITMLFRNQPKQHTIAWIVVLLFGIMSAVSRVVIGAHFPSDVLFSTGITLLLFLFLQQRFLRNGEQEK